MANVNLSKQGANGLNDSTMITELPHSKATRKKNGANEKMSNSVMGKPVASPMHQRPNNAADRESQGTHLRTF